MVLRSARKSSEPPSARKLTSELQAVSQDVPPFPHQWRPEQPLAAISIEDTFLDLLPPNPLQAAFNAKGITYGVQWELERLLRPLASVGVSIEDLMDDDVEQLAGRATDAMPLLNPILSSICRCKNPGEEVPPLPSLRRIAAWSEMDREEEVIRDDSKTFDGVFNSSRDWPYGGRLVFAVGVRYNKDR